MQFGLGAASWWATPVRIEALPDCATLNARLAEIILDRESLLAEAPGSPVAGLDSGLTTRWQSYNVLHWPEPECAILKEAVLAAALGFIGQFADPDDPDYHVAGIAAWANVLRHGQSLRLHHHDQAFVNAHYLVASGHETDTRSAAEEAARNESGFTAYYRPGFIERSHGERRGETLNPWDADWRISAPPTPGRLIFFPSYVRHEVRPYLGTAARISIAFDFYVRKQEALIYFGGPQWFVPD